MILTSYFSNYRNFPKGKKTISISRFPPKWTEVDINALELAPSKELILEYKKGNMTEDEYAVIYKRETLSKLNPSDIYTKYNNGIFLCYEKSSDFCHRKLISEWLNEANLDSEELTKGKRISILGVEDFSDYVYFEKIINRLLLNFIEPVLITSKNNGINEILTKYAAKHNINIETISSYKNITEESDLGIAFWDGVHQGTKDSFEIAKKQNKKLYIVEYKSKKIYTNT